MRDLNYDLKELCRHNRDGSYATQADREHILDLDRRSAPRDGLPGLRAQGLKPKHVEKLVARWLAEELSPGTIKNRMSVMRWTAQKLGKDNIVARTNAAYGIPDRVYVTNVSKAKQLGMEQLESIRTPCAQMSLRLQAAFGLRREDSIKIVPAWADRGDRWCSRIPGPRAGGRSRFPSAPPSSGNSSTKPKHSPRARAWSRRATPPTATTSSISATSVGGSAFTPSTGIGICTPRTRYQELTGWECPARGGPTSRQLTPKQKAIDREARETISHEMGHGREQITAVYLGR